VKLDKWGVDYNKRKRNGELRSAAKEAKPAAVPAAAIEVIDDTEL